VVVANGEEGEPSSRKDRWLLTRRPHAVLDGLLLAARTVDATRAIVYLSHPETVDSVRSAIGELPRHLADLIEVVVTEPRYVAGEETAVCRAINGGPALPLAKPPRPFESGVDARPTLVSNVETLVHAAWIARHGSAAYRQAGTDASPGTGLVSFGGACSTPGVYEVPFGPALRELLSICAGGLPEDTPGLLVGGWFGGVASPSILDVPWCFDELRAAGSSLGCASVTVLGPRESVVSVAARLARWYQAESAGQCGVCRKGTTAIADTLNRVDADEAGEAELADLARWGLSLRGRGACAFLDGAANLARTVSELAGHARSGLGMAPSAVRSEG
jgi:NADH:ubiquinone oxidoreductase subunit F (NADH-binding)